jgi:hypothetical protein
MQSSFLHAPRPLRSSAAWVVVAALLGVGLLAVPASAQNESTESLSAGCILKDHVYTCDGVAFQKALANAKTAAIQTHNTDGIGRARLTELLTTKLGKAIASADNPADIVFLLTPIDQQGNVISNQGDDVLGTLRIYSAAANGAAEHLLWAETFTGPPDMPWPMVVRGLIAQFQSRFHIK